MFEPGYNQACSQDELAVEPGSDRVAPCLRKTNSRLSQVQTGLHHV